MRFQMNEFSYDQNRANRTQTLKIELGLLPNFDGEYLTPSDLKAIEQMLTGAIVFLHKEHKFSIECEGEVWYEHRTNSLYDKLDVEGTVLGYGENAREFVSPSTTGYPPNA